MSGGKSPTGLVRTEAEDAIIREMEAQSRSFERRREVREEMVIVESKTIEEGSRLDRLAFFHQLPKQRTCFYVCLLDARLGFFLPPMPRPGIELTSVKLHLF